MIETRGLIHLKGRYVVCWCTWCTTVHDAYFTLDNRHEASDLSVENKYTHCLIIGADYIQLLILSLTNIFPFCWVMKYILCYPIKAKWDKTSLKAVGGCACSNKNQSNLECKSTRKFFLILFLVLYDNLCSSKQFELQALGSCINCVISIHHVHIWALQFKLRSCI